MKCLFVCIHIEESSRSIPLGVASIAANMKQKLPSDIEVSLLNCYIDQTIDEMVGAIIPHNPDLLGLSIYLWNREASLAIAEEIRKRLPSCQIVVGGPEPTARGAFYRSLDHVDDVIIGEGEDQILALFDQDSSVFPSVHPDLSTLPSPYLDGTISLDAYTGVLWELSRGCPFRCAFCFESRGDKTLRRFSLARISKELELFVEKDVREIFILDPTFNYNLPSAKKLVKMLIEKAPSIHYMMEIRAEFIDGELSDLLSQIDCALQIGLQSIHQDVLKKINRNFDAQQFTDNVFLLHENHVPYGFDLIYGLPGDTLTGFYESLYYTMSLIPNHLDIFPLAVLPGTELFDTARSFGMSYDMDNSWLVSSTPTFSEDDMRQATEFVKKVDIFYNQGKAVTWFDIILQSTEVTPSEFFITAPDPIEEMSPYEYQKAAVASVFTSLEISHLTSLAIDLITYFWEENNRVFELALSEDSGTVINPSITMNSYTYDPLVIIDLCEQGVMNLHDIHGLVEEDPVTLVTYITDEGPAIYYADKERVQVINELRDTTGISEYDEKIITELRSVGLIL